MIGPLNPATPRLLSATPPAVASAPAVSTSEVFRQDLVTLRPSPATTSTPTSPTDLTPTAPPAAAGPLPSAAPIPGNLFMEPAEAPVFSLLESRGLQLARLGSQTQARETLGQLAQALIRGEKAPGRGYLMIGNSGTGKTSLARAVAGELHPAGIPVLGTEGCKLRSPDQVRDLFTEAARRASQSPGKTAVVFVDEVESAIRARSTECSAQAASVNQLMGSFVAEATAAQENPDVQIVLVAATSLKNAIDLEALKCFPIEVPLSIPSNRQERYEVLSAMAGRYALGQNPQPLLVDLAASTPGKNPQELENLLDTATRLCRQRGGSELTRADLRDARLEVSFGPPRAVNSEEWMFRLAACHELSHAATRHLFRSLAFDDQRPDHMPQAIDCITFMPRGTSNAAIYLQASENPATTLDTIIADATTLYGGKAAEHHFGQGHASAGPGSDLSSATQKIQEAVRNYGMAGSLLTSFTGSNPAPTPESQAAEQRLADTCDEMSRSMVRFYADFIGGLAGDITARRHDPSTLTMDGDTFEQAISAWEQASPERQEQVGRLKDYVRRTIDGLRPRPARIFDPVTGQMIEAPPPLKLT